MPTDDMTDRYTTKLSAEDEAQFQKWAAANPRLGGTYDYDARGFWKNYWRIKGRTVASEVKKCLV